MNLTKRSFLTGFISGLSKRSKVLVFLALLIPIYFYYTSGLTANPPGFYIDEAAVSYNAHTIYLRGEGEFGDRMPLYFPVFPLGPPFYYLGYGDPVEIYAIAALEYIFPPSVTLSRGLSSTGMFLTALLLGFLALRISGRGAIGVIVGASALMTPWLEEIGRLAFGASLYPLAAAALLVAVYKAYRSERWSLLDCMWIALALALCTYTYAIGRLLGPLFAFGLILLVTDLYRLKKVLLTWAAYAMTLLPILVFHIRHPDALTGRFNITVGYISPQTTSWEIFTQFVKHYLANISPYRLMFIGDMNLRHHITDTSPLLWVTLFMALAGIIIVFLRYRKEAWWRYVIFGLVVSVIPASLTKDDFHMLRLSAFPVFLLALTIPTWIWLLGDAKERTASAAAFWLRRAAAWILLLLTATQVISFQRTFAEVGPNRGGYFDYNFPPLFTAALEQPERPIYLTDNFAYQALWSAASQGIDESNFVRLGPQEHPPANAVVLSGEERCNDCVMLMKDIPFVLYKTLQVQLVTPVPASTPAPEPAIAEPAPFSFPRGIAADSNGNYYVADTGNSRVQKFDAAGNSVGAFGKRGGGEGEFIEPQGIAVDQAGRIYVTDALNHKLLKFAPDGSFIKEWKGPDTGFYGPRYITFGPDGALYIVDQGRTRIVKFDPSTESYSVWGTAGSGEAQFNDASGIAVGGGLIFVTDTGNGRVEVFDQDGGFLRQWAVPQWENDVHFFTDCVYDAVTQHVYVSSGKSKEILTFDINGNPVAGPAGDGTLVYPSSMAILEHGLTKRLLVLDTSKGAVSSLELESKKK